MAEEKIFNIPLRRAFLGHPRYRHLKVAVRATRDFLSHHLKSDNIKLGKYLNLKLHEHGRKNPPHHVKVKVWKDGEFFKAELFDAPVEKPIETKKLKEKVKEPLKEIKKEEVIKAVETKAEETLEKFEKEKEEVLTHENPKKEEHMKERKERKSKSINTPKKTAKKDKLKEYITKTQKPKHEKSKS